jgi:hypothetical protein
MSKASRKGARFVELFNARVAVFISAEDRKNVALLSSILPKVLVVSAVVSYPAK